MVRRPRQLSYFVRQISASALPEGGRRWTQKQGGYYTTDRPAVKYNSFSGASKHRTGGPAANMLWNAEFLAPKRNASVFREIPASPARL
jgi:hypothetical protein